ncbi:YycC family protein [Shouchella sp. 1P09AA]|nr:MULTISPECIES: YycC family protein [Bacillaceae]UTR06993.1 YycC family protein [Alkalihalobacillus sp. LMS6]
MGPLQLSEETALALSKSLNIPLEQLMHMPKPVLMQKLAELNKEKK